MFFFLLKEVVVDDDVCFIFLRRESDDIVGLFSFVVVYCFFLLPKPDRKET